MIDEEKDLYSAEQAPRRRQRIPTRETERVYSASQDQGERFDTIETERYIKRVIQSRSKEELTAALRALKEQAMPKKKRGRPSKRDLEEQRILKATIARHMDEINATRAALMGDVTGTPVEEFDEETGFAELAQHLAEETMGETGEGIRANAAVPGETQAEETQARTMCPTLSECSRRPLMFRCRTQRRTMCPTSSECSRACCRKLPPGRPTRPAETPPPAMPACRRDRRRSRARRRRP